MIKILYYLPIIAFLTGLTSCTSYYIKEPIGVKLNTAETNNIEGTWELKKNDEYLKVHKQTKQGLHKMTRYRVFPYSEEPEVTPQEFLVFFRKSDDLIIAMNKDNTNKHPNHPYNIIMFLEFDEDNKINAYQFSEKFQQDIINGKIQGKLGSKEHGTNYTISEDKHQLMKIIQNNKDLYLKKVENNEINTFSKVSEIPNSESITDTKKLDLDFKEKKQKINPDKDDYSAILKALTTTINNNAGGSIKAKEHKFTSEITKANHFSIKQKAWMPKLSKYQQTNHAQFHYENADSLTTTILKKNKTNDYIVNIKGRIPAEQQKGEKLDNENIDLNIAYRKFETAYELYKTMNLLSHKASK